MADRDSRVAVNTAGIGRKEPERLRLIVPLDSSSARGAWRGTNGHQHSAIDRFANDRVTARDWPAATVHDLVTADLHRGVGRGGRAAIAAVKWQLRVVNFEQRGQSA